MPEINANDIWPSEDIPWDDVAGTASDFETVYPRLQWNHGRNAFEEIGGFQFTGGLFLPQKQLPEFTAPGWNPARFKTQQGETILGFHSPRAYLAVIRMAKSWGENSSHTTFLVCIRGAEELFEISLEGVTKGKAFETAFEAHRRQIVALVNNNRPNKSKPEIEPLGLWFVVEPAPHSLYESSRNSGAASEVTLPRLHLPPAADLAYARSLFVGSQNYAMYRDYFHATKNWNPVKQRQGDGPPPRSPLQRQLDAILLWLGNQGHDVAALEAETAESYRVGSLDELTESQRKEVIAALELIKRKLINQRAMDAQR